MSRKGICGSRTPSGRSVNSALAWFPTEADVQPRRTVLRGALAAGFGLLAPATLLGCDSQNPTHSAGSSGLSPASDLMPPRPHQPGARQGVSRAGGHHKNVAGQRAIPAPTQGRAAVCQLHALHC